MIQELQIKQSCTSMFSAASMSCQNPITLTVAFRPRSSISYNRETHKHSLQTNTPALPVCPKINSCFFSFIPVFSFPTYIKITCYESNGSSTNLVVTEYFPLRRLDQHQIIFTSVPLPPSSF